MLNRRQFVKRGCIWAGVAALGPMVLQAAPPALIQQKIRQSNLGNFGTTLTSPTTTGSSIIALIGCLSTDDLDPANLPAVDGQFLTLGPTVLIGGVTVFIYYLHNITGGTGVCTGSTEFTTVGKAIWSEWSGLGNAAPEATNTNSALVNSTPTTNGVTPASTANLVIAIGGWTANNYSSGPTNSFTRMSVVGGGSTLFIDGAYLIQAAASAASTGWSLTAPINWVAAIAVFGGPTSGPTNAQRSAGFWVMP